MSVEEQGGLSAGVPKGARERSEKTLHGGAGGGPSADLLRKLRDLAWRPVGAPTGRGDGGSMNGRTILVAEDNGAIRGLVARVLGCEGYRVLQAADGLEAWSVCEQRGYEIALVITDMVMPRMDGAELCRLIHQRWPRMGTLLMTGSAEGLLLDGALRGRFVRLLRKPFRPTELLTAARQALYDNALAPERGDSVRSAGPARPCSESASALTEICCVS